jgi:predicted CoA-binding protein
MKPTIAIVGASNDRNKFGNRAVRAYLRQGFEVFPVHPTAEVIEGVRAYPTVTDIPLARLDRVSVYVPPHIGIGIIDDIATKAIGELWLNPGSESAELVEKAGQRGLNVVVGCSIIDVGEDPHR